MKSKIVNLYILVTALAIPALFMMSFKNTKKVGYITTLKVFEEFKLKKELESEFKKVQIARQTYLDSLKLNLQSLGMRLEKNHDNETIVRFDEAKKMYLMKERQFTEENENVYNSYTEQIWKQLNQYMEDYGKENKYDYLFGASGQGNIMYASEGEDVTKEIIEYVNNKYVGKKHN